ncbi:PD-(D/E)XK nuclease family protein [Bacteroidales bacterium OttesenSCG-928-A17]|nr:PD-(D/E)XK nuclease family protein [Bacteroidales bacterium OttesenSCG-928-A17]
MSDNNNDTSVDFKQEKEWYKDLLKDPNFEKLGTELQKPNIFSILGIGRAEIRHSNFLAWLLDPNESHGLGNRFLIRVLRDLALEKNQLDIINIENLNFSNVEVGREVKCPNGSMDLLIKFKDDELIICIENKFDTLDSDGQLNSYQTFIENDEGFKEYTKIFVYLTPSGDNPKNYTGNEWHTYSYKEIINHLENIKETAVDTTIKTYISDYITTLKREIMGTNDKAAELANAIYDKHKDIIDFVSNNKDRNKKYESIWERDFPWVCKFAEKLKDSIIKVADPTSDYELGYNQNYISIKQKRKNQNRYYNIYSINQRAEPHCALTFEFSTKEDETSTRKNVKEIVEKNKQNIDSKINCTDGTYFAINFVDKLSEETLKRIHKVRFGIE